MRYYRFLEKVRLFCILQKLVDVDDCTLFRNGVAKVLFIPYALPDRDAYYKKINDVFAQMGK